MLDKFQLRDGTIDVWPLYRVDIDEHGDETGTLLLQLACVLHMVHEWKGTTVLRIMIIGGAVRDRDEESHVKSLLQDLRIAADVVMVSQDSEHLKSNLHADCFLDVSHSNTLHMICGSVCPVSFIRLRLPFQDLHDIEQQSRIHE
jgi:hypothetical protein